MTSTTLADAATDAAKTTAATSLNASHEDAAAWAKKTLAGLSLRQKIGQMICEQMRGDVAEGSAEWKRILELVRRHEIGAFVVYGGSPVKTAATLNRLQKESKLPLLMSIDFEGGPGQQLAGATEFPGNMALAAAESEDLAYRAAKVGATEGRACGFHLNYSPVVDVSTRPDHPASSVRSFGGDVDLVCRMAAAYVRGYQENGMLAAAKHFPGRGDVDAIPGTPFTANNKPAERVEAEDFRPFKAAIDAGAAYVMSEHVAVPSVTGGSTLPASVEKKLVADWLRGKLGFQGVLTTDDLWYDHVVKRFGPAKVCVMAVQAGHDAVLKPADVPAAIDALVQAVESGDIPRERIDRSVEKILYWKARLGLHRERLVDLDKIPAVVANKEHTAVLNEVADRSLTLLVNKGFFPADMGKYRKIVHLSVQKNPRNENVAPIASKLAKAFGNVEHFALGAQNESPDLKDRALAAAKSADLVVVSLLCQRGGPGDNAPIADGRLALLRQVIAAKPDAVVVMSYGNPYFVEKLKDATAFVVGYGEGGWFGNQTIHADSFIRLLQGRITAQGKLPVKVSDAVPIGSGIHETSLARTVDLNVGQTQTVTLHDGSKAAVKLVGVEETRDPVRGAMRGAKVRVEINGRAFVIPCGPYHLPRELAGVQIDCPVVKGFLQPKLRGHNKNPWSLDADARLRLWPKGSPWIQPGTLGYPVRQRWFVGMTQMGNEIADAETPGDAKFYYHYGLDFGGCERLVDVLAVADGVVVSVAGKRAGRGPFPEMLEPRYDVVYVRDARGWYYRYSHFDSIDPAVALGASVKMGQRLGALGKEGASGGWAHLHLDIDKPQPSGRYGIEDAYAYFWQAYQAEHPTPLTAVARPHVVSWVNEPITLDGNRSVGETGAGGLRYEWLFDDGATATGPVVARRYAKPGMYAETLKVTDSAGRVDYDFARVYVQDKRTAKQQPPRIHATYWPSLDLKPGDEITFKARTLGVRPDEGRETWDFGDGTPPVTTQSDGGKNPRAKDGYAVTTHRYAKPGVYLVRVTRSNARGEPAAAKLAVHVASP